MDCWVGGAAIRLFRYSSREQHSLEAYRNIRSLSSVALRNGRFCFAFSYPRAWERQTSTNSDGHTISHPEATSSPQSTAATGQWLHSSKLLAKHFPSDVWNGTLTSRRRRKPRENSLAASQFDNQLTTGSYPETPIARPTFCFTAGNPAFKVSQDLTKQIGLCRL
jgi:hypothetical protein